ncbi:GPI inositol-deacylase [Electrophorus electricus]|uniref:GPI inositol-deacylase n=1 Tax=Electrophorus electricus TaxID=8005 RepID=UPI0015D03CB9|nr:GPI inositol-deacylase [Electrophorus electricus]
MKVVVYAFYGGALGCLLLALRELFLGLEENRCSMTYMFEYPEYRRVQLPRYVARQYPAYGLYLYGEGVYAQETRGLKLTGAPVLFLPGNAGSYKQGRSLGSVALRKAENMEGGIHLNVFTIDFNEELVALYGGGLLRQTHFLHESIKVILRLYKDRPDPPQSVVLVGHSMGGVVARALFTLPGFSPGLVSLILTQASPHQAPVLSLDPYILEFYSSVSRRWSTEAEDLRNVTVLSVGGGYRDYQVRSGLTALSCSADDPNKMAVVVTAVPRTWVSTDHLSIVWCKELVLATVRAFFDLIEPETRQFTEDAEKRRSVLSHHFIQHTGRLQAHQLNRPISFSGLPESWSEVNTLRLIYSAPKEAKEKYFLFVLSSRRKAYSHFHCRSSDMEMSSWLFGCTKMDKSMCVQAVDLSWRTELLPAYKVVTVKLGELSAMSHLVIDASNPSARQFTVECEWQREERLTVPLSVPHVLAFGLTTSDITINSSGLLHTIQLKHFHQVYQAFKIIVTSHCMATKDRLPNIYRIKVPWFREDSFVTAGIPSVTEMSGMLHTSRHDNTSSALLQLHTSPNCQYKVSVRSSFSKVLGQVLRSCGPVLLVYTAAVLLLALRRQLGCIIQTGHTVALREAAASGLQPHKVELPILILHLSLRQGWFQEGWTALGLPDVDMLPLTTTEDISQDAAGSWQYWPHLVSLLLCVLGAAVAFWGSAVLSASVHMLSFLLGPLHRPSVSRHSGTLRPSAQILLILSLIVVGGATCGALAIAVSFLIHLYRVLRLKMTERSLSYMMNLAPQRMEQNSDNGYSGSGRQKKFKECNGGSLLSKSELLDVRDDLQLHLSLSTLLTLPMMLSAPSLVYWSRNLRYSVRLDPDPWWPYTVPLLVASVLLTNCSTNTLSHSKLMLGLTSRLLLPLSVAMTTFSPLHLYRVTHFVSVALTLLVTCCHI